jgi:hypothetical protein
MSVDCRKLNRDFNLDLEPQGNLRCDNIPLETYRSDLTDPPLCLFRTTRRFTRRILMDI